MVLKSIGDRIRNTFSDSDDVEVSSMTTSHERAGLGNPSLGLLPASTRGGFVYQLLQWSGSDRIAETLFSGAADAPITRYEAAQIIAEVLELGEVLSGQPAVFPDVPLAMNGAIAIYRCVEEGIFAPVSLGMFMPGGELGQDADSIVQRSTNPAQRLSFDREGSVEAGDRDLLQSPGAGEHHDPQNALTKQLYAKHVGLTAAASRTIQDDNRELTAFERQWETHRARYEAIAKEVDFPPKFIAALHWRESSGNFNKVIHNGDPIGRRTTNVPAGLLFHTWEDSVRHALVSDGRGTLKADLNINYETQDEAALMVYAERYNGLGYHNRGNSSPYAYAGTSAYERGKFVADKKYSSTAVDTQIGVLVAMRSGEAELNRRQSTLLEGQVHAKGEPIGPMNIRMIEVTGEMRELKIDAQGFFSLDKELLPGPAKLLLEGRVIEILVQAGSPTWASIDLLNSEGIALGVIRRGSKGPDVAILQTLLNDKHGTSLATDGDFGSGTDRAVRDFQRARGLAVDGVVGNNSWRALGLSY